MSKWPIQQEHINKLQIQISNFCNLACPSCARTKRLNKDKELMNNTMMNIDFFKSIFNQGKWTNLRLVTICGNIEEPTMHPDLIEMIHYCMSIHNDVSVFVSTNGSTRTEKYYAELGKLSADTKGRLHIVFAIDGLEDTNHIYRVGSNWNKIQSNFRAYISAGGRAVWQFVVLEHNKHQLEQVREFQKTEGFKLFWVRYSGRNDKVSIKKPEEIISKSVECTALYSKIDMTPKIFINHLGQMTPCCYIDLSNLIHFMKYKEILTEVGVNAYDLHYNTVENILSGPWFDWLFDNFQTNSICNFHCKLNNRDHVLKPPAIQII